MRMIPVQRTSSLSSKGAEPHDSPGQTQSLSCAVSQPRTSSAPYNILAPLHIQGTTEQEQSTLAWSNLSSKSFQISDLGKVFLLPRM